MNNIFLKKTKPTILLVDDVASNLMVLSSLLEDDYDVKVAKSAKKAFEILNNFDCNIDLILLDIIMPEMDGYEMCKILKNDSNMKNIPLIFVTAKVNEEDEEYGLNIGAIDYITKPYNQTIVKLRVRNQIEAKLKSDMLEELSMYDGLTNIPNRRFFDERFEQLYKECVRDKNSLSVMMLDIDYFKAYNDNYGHGKGDEALKKVASALLNTLKRPTDFLARYGGEEFVVLLKDISNEDILFMAKSLLEAVEELNIEHNYSSTQPYITLSIGVALKNKDVNIPKEDLLKAADDALYEAKAQGRNQYIISTVRGV
jgi:diguanylate cyclase (GGDEF)-like protein